MALCGPIYGPLLRSFWWQFVVLIYDPLMFHLWPFAVRIYGPLWFHLLPFVVLSMAICCPYLWPFVGLSKALCVSIYGTLRVIYCPLRFYLWSVVVLYMAFWWPIYYNIRFYLWPFAVRIYKMYLVAILISFFFRDLSFVTFSSRSSSYVCMSLCPYVTLYIVIIFRWRHMDSFEICWWCLFLQLSICQRQRSPL